MQAGEVFREPLQPLGRAVDREHLGAGRCELRGLAAGRGAEIGDALAGLRLEQAGGQGGGGILHPPFAVLVAGQLADRGALDEADAAGGQKHAAEALGPGFRIRLHRHIDGGHGAMRLDDLRGERLAVLRDPALLEPGGGIEPGIVLTKDLHRARGRRGAGRH